MSSSSANQGGKSAILSHSRCSKQMSFGASGRRVAKTWPIQAFAIISLKGFDTNWRLGITFA